MSNLYQLDFKVVKENDRFKIFVSMNGSEWNRVGSAVSMDKALEDINYYKSWMKNRLQPKEEEIVYTEKFTIPVDNQ